jgi:hypothetical protein
LACSQIGTSVASIKAKEIKMDESENIIEEK